MRFLRIYFTVGFSKLYTLEFRTIFGNWQVGGEFRNYISKFGSNFRTLIWNSEIQIVCLLRNTKDVGEKTWWRITKLDGFFSKPSRCRRVDRYLHNKFGTRMQIKLQTLKEIKFRMRMQIKCNFNIFFQRFVNNGRLSYI